MATRFAFASAVVLGCAFVIITAGHQAAASADTHAAVQFRVHSSDPPDKTHSQHALLLVKAWLHLLPSNTLHGGGGAGAGGGGVQYRSL